MSKRKIWVLAGLMTGFAATVQAQSLSAAEMRAKLDAALDAQMSRPHATRGIVLNNSQDFRQNLYPDPAPQPQPAQQIAAPPLSSHPPPQVTAATSAFDIDIKFDFNSDRVAPAASANLKRMAGVLADPALLENPRYRNAVFLVVGHTDAKGAAAYNLSLSRRRANSIVNYLVHKGVPERRLLAIGRGKEQLLDPAHPESEANRRVEVEVLVEASAAN